jgi:hypothetical protein
VRKLYARFVQSGDLCFDVGAHVGDRTRAPVELGARVVSVDPQAYAIRRLAVQFARNSHVSIVAKALGEAPGQGVLAICDAAPTISTLSLEFQRQSRFTGSHEWARTESVGHLGDLGMKWFNFTFAESHRLELASCVGGRELIGMLTEGRRPDAWGDVYALCNPH